MKLKDSACRAAFAAYMRTQNTESTFHGWGASRRPLTDDAVVRLFIESYEDWCMAAQWGKANPKDVELAPSQRAPKRTDHEKRWDWATGAVKHR